MSALPLPATLAPHVGIRTKTNRSLVFDRGFDGYNGGWSIEAGNKLAFLEGFKRGFSPPDDFEPFVERRHKALEATRAKRVALYSQTRLVIGLGLPHPTETALLLDRLTGSPYLPGSSVKGLLRETARLVGSGELDTGDATDAGFWAEHFDRLLGPLLGGEATPAKGELVVYDAFPDEWPVLEIDVLTPHFVDYYGDSDGKQGVVPADWHDPVPVAFLSVKAGTKVSFWLGHWDAAVWEAELERVERLLLCGMNWLGIGGKTSSGYGLFGPEMPQLEPKRFTAEGGRGPDGGGGSGGEPPPPEPEPETQEALWKGVTLELYQGKPTIFRGKKQRAEMRKEDLPAALKKQLKKKKELKVDAWVVPGVGDAWRIVRCEGWEK